MAAWCLQESERYAYEWQRCLESALEVCVSVFSSCLVEVILMCSRSSLRIKVGNVIFSGRSFFALLFESISHRLVKPTVMESQICISLAFVMVS